MKYKSTRGGLYESVITKFIVVIVLGRELLHLGTFLGGTKFLHLLTSISEFFIGELNSFSIDLEAIILVLDLSTVKVL